MKEQEIDNHQLAIRYFEGRITPSEEEILFRFLHRKYRRNFRKSLHLTVRFPEKVSRKQTDVTKPVHSILWNFTENSD